MSEEIITKDNLSAHLETATLQLLDLAGTSCWNYISDEVSYVLTTIDARAEIANNYKNNPKSYDILNQENKLNFIKQPIKS